MPADALRDVLALHEAAVEFNLKPQSLRRAAQRGHLRAKRVGRPSFPVWITTREAMAEYVDRSEAARIKKVKTFVPSARRAAEIARSRSGDEG